MARAAIKALSWSDVAAIVEQFDRLNPYDRHAVPDSVLKIEGYNFGAETKRQRQLYCFAISSKRYALFTLDDKGRPTITKCSEHGLGHLLNPTDIDSDDRKWIPRVWLNIVRRALGLRTRPLPFEHRPAIGRIAISSPAVMRPLARLNDGKPYGQQLKPFNFLLSCHVRAFGHPTGADAERFHLIAPFESDPTRWIDIEWIDQYTRNTYRVTTIGHHGGRGVARVKTYGVCLRNTSGIRKLSLRMRTARLRTNKRSAYYSAGTSRSITSSTSAESRTSSKMWRPASCVRMMAPTRSIRTAPRLLAHDRGSRIKTNLIERVET